MAPSYYTPTFPVTTTTFEKKSRFVTNLIGVSSKEQAVSQLQNIAAREVGANHNCSAYIIGNPASSTDIHCSDDGEPSGTAGKPMLNILLHEHIGNVLVVVTRYFGGVKLGTGGLVRAYSTALKTALEEVELQEYVARCKVGLRFAYPFESVVRRKIDDFEGELLAAEYREDVMFDIVITEKRLEPLVAELSESTAGRIVIDRKG